MKKKRKKSRAKTPSCSMAGKNYEFVELKKDVVK